MFVSSHETVVFTRLHPAHPVPVPTIHPTSEKEVVWAQSHDTEIIIATVMQEEE